MEYKELAREGEGDDADPDVMMGTQPGGTLKNVAFRVKNRCTLFFAQTVCRSGCWGFRCERHGGVDGCRRSC